jgi:transcriptional regulator with XRE-family HTH domain
VAESLAALAWDLNQEHLGVDANMVSKWERGIKRPRKLYRRLLSTLYGATEEELGCGPCPLSRQSRMPTETM